MSQLQHDDDAHGSQKEKSPQSVSIAQLGAHVRAYQRHVSPLGQGSSSSQRPASSGTQAPRQSRQSGQLAVAQGAHVEPGPQVPQVASPQAGAQSPVENTHTASGQSAWEVHGPPPVLELVAVVVVPVAVVVAVVDAALPAPDRKSVV